MGNVIIITVLVVVVIAAIVSSAKHFKGDGGCCGGGGSVSEYKKLEGPKLGEKQIQIEGMHCENCKNRVEHGVNKIDGAVCKVNLKKKMATVSYSRKIEDEVLKKVIENLGYEVVSISNK